MKRIICAWIISCFLGVVSEVLAGPDLIPLPNGFGPEGIAIGNGTTFYVGSLGAATLGQILVGDLETGNVSELTPPTGRPALGMKFDPRSNMLFVAGGPSGRGTVIDAATGKEIAFYQFQPPSSPAPAIPTTTINDVVLTPNAAYFTESRAPFLYRVRLSQQGVPAPTAETISLPDNFGKPGACSAGPKIQSNGIAASADGRYLILVHMSEGRLYRFDTTTDTMDAISLTGGDVCTADGLLLDGDILYAVQNFLNRIAVVRLSDTFLAGNVLQQITEPFASNAAVQVPTTIGKLGGSLYVVTAGFAPPEPDFVARLPLLVTAVDPRGKVSLLWGNLKTAP